MDFCALTEQAGDETTPDRISTREIIMILDQRQGAGLAFTTAVSGAESDAEWCHFLISLIGMWFASRIGQIPTSR